MAKTYSTLRSHTRTYLDESSPADWTDAQINRELNFAYMEVYTAVVETFESYYRVVSTANLVANQQEYAVPSDFLKMVRLEVKYDSTGDFYKAGRFDFQQLSTGYDNDTYGSTSRPLYQITGGYIRLLPIPTTSVTSGLRMEYIKTISELSSDTDEINIPFPDRYGRLITLGAAAQLLRKGQQEESVAAKYQEDFQIGLEKMKQELEDRNTDGTKVILDVLGENINFERTPVGTIIAT